MTHNTALQRTVKKLRFLPPAELERYALKNQGYQCQNLM